MKLKRCAHCETLFEVDKFHPKQAFCTDPQCKSERRKDYKRKYNKEWRDRNPNYFKEYWLQYRDM